MGNLQIFLFGQDVIYLNFFYIEESYSLELSVFAIDRLCLFFKGFYVIFVRAGSNRFLSMEMHLTAACRRNLARSS